MCTLFHVMSTFNIVCIETISIALHSVAFESFHLEVGEK